VTAVTVTADDIAQRIQLLRAAQLGWQRDLQDAEQDAVAAESNARPHFTYILSPRPLGYPSRRGSLFTSRIRSRG
jgi:hypothetical protein